MNQKEIALPILLKRCARLIDQNVDQTLKRYSIARSQYRVLYYVDYFGEPTQSELMNVMTIQAPTLSPIIDVLVQKGWLVRLKDRQDKRCNRLRLTPIGEKKFRQIPDPVRKLQHDLILNLEGKDAQLLEDSLEKIVNILSEGEGQ